jgi:hypothetical protein
MAELNRGQESAGAIEEKAGGVGSWLVGVFFDPKSTFTSLADSVEKPHPKDSTKTKDASKWLIPVIITAIVAMGIALYTVPNFVAPMQADAIREVVAERGGTPEQAAQAIQTSTRMMLPMSIVGAIVGTFVIVFVASGLAHLFMKMVGGKGRFRNARAVVAWSMLVGTLGSIIKLPLMIAKGSMFVETSPTLFFRNLEPSDRLYKFLSSFDIFTIWWVVILIVGLAIGYKTTRGKSAVAVVLLWILMILLATFSPGGFGASM